MWVESKLLAHLEPSLSSHLDLLLLTLAPYCTWLQRYATASFWMSAPATTPACTAPPPSCCTASFLSDGLLQQLGLCARAIDPKMKISASQSSTADQPETRLLRPLCIEQGSFKRLSISRIESQGTRRLSMHMLAPLIIDTDSLVWYASQTPLVGLVHPPRWERKRRHQRCAQLGRQCVLTTAEIRTMSAYTPDQTSGEMVSKRPGMHCEFSRARARASE